MSDRNLKAEVFEAVKRLGPVGIGDLRKAVWAPRDEIQRILYNWQKQGSLTTAPGDKWGVRGPLLGYPKIPAHCLGEKRYDSWIG